MIQKNLIGSDVSWAQLEKIQILIQNNELKKAYEECINVVNASEWRGRPAVIATFFLERLKNYKETIVKHLDFINEHIFNTRFTIMGMH